MVVVLEYNAENIDQELDNIVIGIDSFIVKIKDDKVSHKVKELRSNIVN